MKKIIKISETERAVHITSLWQQQPLHCDPGNNERQQPLSYSYSNTPLDFWIRNLVAEPFPVRRLETFERMKCFPLAFSGNMTTVKVNADLFPP